MRLQPDFDASVDETDGSGYASRYPDVPLDGLGRFQIDRVGHPMGYNGRFQSNDRLPPMQRLRNFGVNVYENIGFEGGGQERPRFEARLSINLAEGGRGRRVRVNRSVGVSCPLDVWE